MNKEFWKKHIRRGVLIFFVVKTVMGLQNVLYPKPVIQRTNVSHKLETIYDVDSEKFKVLDKSDVSFLLRPRVACDKSISAVVMALSAPKNTQKREKLRRLFQNRTDVALVFLLGEIMDKEITNELREENVAHGDLLQISVKDHYTALSYKTLSGFIWINRYLTWTSSRMLNDDLCLQAVWKCKVCDED